jgi:hypothetical protein
MSQMEEEKTMTLRFVVGVLLASAVAAVVVQFLRAKLPALGVMWGTGI